MKKKTLKKKTPAKKINPVLLGLAERIKQIHVIEPMRAAQKVLGCKQIIPDKCPRDESGTTDYFGVDFIHGPRAVDSLTRVAISAKKGDRGALQALRKIATTATLMLNEIADTECAGCEPLKNILATYEAIPQMIGPHPKTIREATSRIKRVGVSTRHRINLRATDSKYSVNPV